MKFPSNAVLLPILATLSPSIHATPQGDGTRFVHWETPQVHPLAMTPGGGRLLAVNTADARLEVFQLGAGLPRSVASVPVGLDPVSVCARSDREAWVVNHLSDSVSVVDLELLTVVATLATLDEPTDVVFLAGQAFVSCSQANSVLVFDLANRDAKPRVVPIDGEDPRALAVDAKRGLVYAAIFESGNRSTILGDGIESRPLAPPNVVSDPSGPWGGVNPPPNAGPDTVPAMARGLPPPPPVGLIVKQDASGRWRDDNDGDWTELVSGDSAWRSGRPQGWELLDHDVAILDARTLSVTYAGGLMNLCMSLAVNPRSGEVAVVGTDARNEVRYEENLSGRFVTVELGLLTPWPHKKGRVVGLNPHLASQPARVAEEQRELSLGDPRAIVFAADGLRGYVAGMGSNNVVVIDAHGRRTTPAPIEVGEGPTGLALDEARNLLYVLDRFEASISVVDLGSLRESARVPYFDPTPETVRRGRRFLYDTHATSGTGAVSCASCHVDARMDRLAWDLGDPRGSVKPVEGNLGADAPRREFRELSSGFEDWHPMKGPLMTQTLLDIIGKEPFHWRGDRRGLEDFNPAFETLLGDDEQLTPEEMRAFESYLATISVGPNPFCELDGSFSRALPLPGHLTTGDFGPAGMPLPPGDAERGRFLFRETTADVLYCGSCHTPTTGMGTNTRFDPSCENMVLLLCFRNIPPGPQGERHLMLSSRLGFSNATFKVAGLRNLYDKVGMDTHGPVSRAGFGFFHNGSIDSLERVVINRRGGGLRAESDQDVADVVAFLLSFSGELDAGGFRGFRHIPGKNTHPAVGAQVTLSSADAPGELERLGTLLALAEDGRIGLVARGDLGGRTRGFTYVAKGSFQSDRSLETATLEELLQAAREGTPLVLTAVPAGTEKRIGIDRDADGVLDGDELERGSDPSDPGS